jgi:hypothetical protein
MVNDILTFTPYLGDTFLSSAVARKIAKVNGDNPYLLALNQEMAGIIVADWMGSSHLGHPYDKFIKEGSLWNEDKVNITSKRENGKWYYNYQPDYEYEMKMKKLCSEILDVFEGDTIYTLHNTYPHALLGSMASERFISVRGYYLSKVGNLFVSTPNGSDHADIWTDEFIGDRICRFATGRGLDKEDFEVTHGPSPLEDNTVTLFPSTRSKSLNAGHWDLDVQLLKEMGYKVRVAVHRSESHDKKLFDDPLVSQVEFTDIAGLVHLITSSEFIVANDSIAYHLAWHYGTRAVVKMKGGFQREWQPRWVRDNPSYQFIPATQYFQEEYAHIFKQKVMGLS